MVWGTIKVAPPVVGLRRPHPSRPRRGSRVAMVDRGSGRRTDLLGFVSSHSIAPGQTRLGFAFTGGSTQMTIGEPYVTSMSAACNVSSEGDSNPSLTRW